MNEGSAKRVNESAAERAWRLLALAYAAGLGAMMLSANRAFYHDDAYITLRYARNLIDGAGVVWNPGEYVQGYTNFLHLMLVSCLGRLGIDLLVASRVVGVAALLSLVVLLISWSRRDEDESTSRLWHVPAILVMTSAPMLVWSVGALEGTLFSALVASGCLLFLLGLDAEVGAPAFIASGACLGMSFLTRPDPAAFVGSIIGKHIAQAWPEGSLVAFNTAGSTPYYAHRHRYVDMLGLNDAHIAKRHIEEVELRWQLAPGHLKGDGSYLLDRRPDFVMVGPAEGTLVSKPWFLSDLELSRDPRFADDYEIARVGLDRNGRVVEEDGLVFTYYRRMRD